MPPLHAIGVIGLTVNVGADGLNKATDVVAVQPLASVATMVYVPATKPVNVPAGDCVPEIGNIVYVLLPVPPLAVTATKPVVTQVGLLVPATETVNEDEGSVIIDNVLPVHPLASVATIVYDPAGVLIGLLATLPFTVNVFVPVPPDAENVKLPFAPKHVAFVDDCVATTAVGCVTVIKVVIVALLASVADTVYVPAIAL